MTTPPNHETGPEAGSRTRLTPTDILTLRLSCPSLRALGGGVNMGVPFILYLPAEDAFCLHAYGSPQAKSQTVALLAECLRQERAEPGFIRRILSNEEPVDAASLNPAERAAWHRARASEAATARQLAFEADARDRARANRIDPAKLSLDDI